MRTTSEISWTDVERAEITAERDRILADPKFNSSRQCVLLLHYLVESSLRGNREHIKERTLGIEVFGRAPDYDANADTVVRRTASEIRKRLAQHYESSGIPHVVKIRLAVGSYIPEFDFEAQRAAVIEAEPAISDIPIQLIQSKTASTASSGRIQLLWAACCTVVLLLAVAAPVVIHRRSWQSTEYLIWKPLIDSNGKLIVCVPDSDPVPNEKADAETAESKKAGSTQGSVEPSADSGVDHLPRTLFIEANVASQISGRLSVWGKPAILRDADSLTMREIRHAPFVVVGGFDNPWASLLLAKLRYSLREDSASGERWIQDSQNPAKKEWMIDSLPKQAGMDYGLISRFRDNDTGEYAIVISGLSPYGVEAAAALLTASGLAKSLPESLRTAKNFQLVVETQVIDRSSSSPHVLAIQVW